jgi:hypothetical protein
MKCSDLNLETWERRELLERAERPMEPVADNVLENPGLRKFPPRLVGRPRFWRAAGDGGRRMHATASATWYVSATFSFFRIWLL